MSFKRSTNLEFECERLNQCLLNERSYRRKEEWTRTKLYTEVARALEKYICFTST